MAAIVDLPTALTGKSTHTYIRRTNLITAKFVVVTNPTRIRPLYESTWKFMVKAHRLTAPVTTRTIQTMTAIAIRHLQVRHHQHRPHRRQGHTCRDTQVLVLVTQATTVFWVPCPLTIRLICPSGIFAKVRPGCLLHHLQSTRLSDQWPTYTIQHLQQWLTDAQPWSHLALNIIFVFKIDCPIRPLQILFSLYFQSY